MVESSPSFLFAQLQTRRYGSDTMLVKGGASNQLGVEVEAKDPLRIIIIMATLLPVSYMPKTPFT